MDFHRQAILKVKFDNGDTKIDICSCGAYFVNEKWNNGVYNGKFIIFDKCLSCRRKEKNQQIKRTNKNE